MTLRIPRRGLAQAFALIVILMIDRAVSPQFFNLHLQDGRLFGSVIDVLNRGTPVALLSLGIGFTDLCKQGAGMDHVALKAGVDVAGFAAKIRRHRPRTIAFTSKKAASLFYRKPTGAIALGRQSEQDDFPTAFVLASPSGAASGAWTLQPWQDLAEHVASG